MSTFAEVPTENDMVVVAIVVCERGTGLAVGFMGGLGEGEGRAETQIFVPKNPV